MTDKFVPFKPRGPGLYWAIWDGEMTVLHYNGSCATGLGCDQDIPVDATDWIAPVTPPDVVREVREVLARLADTVERIGGRGEELDAARAVIAKLGKAGAP